MSETTAPYRVPPPERARLLNVLVRVSDRDGESLGLAIVVSASSVWDAVTVRYGDGSMDEVDVSRIEEGTEEERAYYVGRAQRGKRAARLPEGFRDAA